MRPLGPLTKTYYYLKNRLLKGAPVWEAEGPWPLDLCDFVHGVQVQTGVLLRLATWQEVDATQGRHDSAAEGPEKKTCKRFFSLSLPEIKRTPSALVASILFCAWLKRSSTFQAQVGSNKNLRNFRHHFVLSPIYSSLPNSTTLVIIRTRVGRPSLGY